MYVNRLVFESDVNRIWWFLNIVLIVLLHIQMNKKIKMENYRIIIVITVKLAHSGNKAVSHGDFIFLISFCHKESLIILLYILTNNLVSNTVLRQTVTRISQTIRINTKLTISKIFSMYNGDHYSITPQTTNIYNINSYNELTI